MSPQQTSSVDTQALDCDLLNQLNRAGNKFLSSVWDPESLQSFYSNWISLSEKLEGDSIPETSKPTLSLLANGAADTIRTLSKCFVDVGDWEERVATELNDSVLAIVDGDSSQNKGPQSPPSNGGDGIVGQSRDTANAVLHAWLMANIHNPYPSLTEKKKLSLETCLPPKAITDWFADMRRRIGWNLISNRYFRGRRPETIECAIRVLKEGADHPYSEDVVQEFAKMKEAAEHLRDVPIKYGKREQKSDNATGSRNAVKKRSRTMTLDNSEIVDDTKDQKNKRRKVSGSSVDSSASTLNDASDNRLGVSHRTVSSSTDRTYINDSPTAEKRDLISTAVFGTAKHSRYVILVSLDLLINYGKYRHLSKSSTPSVINTTSTASPPRSPTLEPSSPFITEPTCLPESHSTETISNAVDKWLSSISSRVDTPSPDSTHIVSPLPKKRRLSEDEDEPLPASKRTRAELPDASAKGHHRPTRKNERNTQSISKRTSIHESGYSRDALEHPSFITQSSISEPSSAITFDIPPPVTMGETVFATFDMNPFDPSNLELHGCDSMEPVRSSEFSFIFFSSI